MTDLAWRKQGVNWFHTAGLLLLLALPGMAQNTSHRPDNWARPMALPGVPNCYRVTTNLYRGAQPTEAGMRQLKALGIKTVINLRAFHSDAVGKAGLKNIHLETTPWHLEETDVVAFLKEVANSTNLPVFVHCERGADRTGTMCAMYRIVLCGWTKSEAIAEMENGGFKFNPVWKNLVALIENADVAEIRRRLGMPPPP